MAADQAPGQAGQGEAAITRLLRAVTQPGGKDVDWEKVGAVGGLIGALTVIFGLKSRSWRHIRTAAGVLAIGAAVAGRLKRLAVAPEARRKANDRDLHEQ
jgi:hypothetical protein